MNIQKFRWSKVYESSEEELIAFLKNRSIEATRIASREPGEQIQQTTKSDTTIWCAEGSLIIHVEPANISLQSGDAIYIPALTTYDLYAGISGFACYLSS
jgi:mannose-6-phosphate isomerase class I